MKRASAAFVLLGALLCAAVLLHCGGSEVVGRVDGLGGSEVVGKLVNRDNQPVNGAVVKVYRDSLDTAKTPVVVETTDNNGRFVAHISDTGNYVIYGRYVKSADTPLVAFIPNVKVDSVAPKNTEPYQYPVGTHTLLPPGSISGRVTVYSGQNAQILVFIPGTSYLAMTDDSGKFKISNVPPGTYAVRFSKDNFSRYTINSITIVSGRDTALAPVELTLDPDAPLPAPTGLTATPDTKRGSVEIRWNRVPVSDINGYIVSRGEGSSLPVPVDTILAPDTSYVDIVYTSSNDTLPKKITYTVRSLDMTSSESLTPASVVVNVVPPFTVTPVFQSVPDDTVVEFNETVSGACRIYCRVDFKVFLSQPGSSVWIEIPHDSTGLAPITFSTGTRSSWGQVAIRAASAADTVDTSFTVRIIPRAVTIDSTSATKWNVTATWTRSPDSDFVAYILHFRPAAATVDSIVILSNVTDTFLTVYTLLKSNIRFTVEVQDTENLFSALSPPKGITIVNSPPRFVTDTSKIDDSVNIGAQLSFALSAYDVNSDSLTFTFKTSLPGLIIRNDSVVFEPAETVRIGSHKILIIVTDRHGGTDTLVWNIIVVAHDVWVPADSLYFARRLFGAVALNGRIFVIGGQADNLSTGSKVALKTVEAYDTATGTWKQKRSLTTARWAPMVAVWNNKIYVFGGSSERNYSITSIEEYNPQADTWTLIGQMPFSRSNGMACVIGDSLYCIGGKSYDAAKGYEVIVKSIDVYNLVSGAWSPGPALWRARTDHRALVNGGLAYIIGGTGSDADSVSELSDGTVLSSIEVFNPAGTGSCDSLMTLMSGRSNFGGVFQNGLIYCIGGLGSLTRTEVLPVEITDVTLLKSTQANSFSELRYSHQTVELGGRIYCIGGVQGTGKSTTGSVKVYHP